MNIHIIQDQSFALHFKRDFVPLSKLDNIFILFTKDKNIILKDKDLHIAHDATAILKTIASNKSIRNIFIHYITPDIAKIIHQIEGKYQLICCFYGGEAFNLPAFETELYQTKTFDWYKKNINRWGSFWENNIISIRQKMRKIAFYRHQLSHIYNAFERLDFFCHYLEKDAQLINSKLHIQPRFLPFTYGSLEDYNVEKYIAGDNIWVGNSADISNNHVEVFEFLANFDLREKQIFVPLSYPKYLAKTYVKWVVAQGEYYLGKNFKPLLEFLPLNDYTNLINSCSIVMMNHNRSQAGGNNMAAIYSGAKLFLNPKNNLFDHYNGLGIRIFDINQLENLNQENLSNAQIEHNRTQLSSFFGKTAHLKRYNDIINILE